MTDSDTYLTCPFCGDSCILPKPGKVRCPMCFSKFEIDDRLECMFADTDDLKLPKVAPSVHFAVLFRLVIIRVVCPVEC